MQPSDGPPRRAEADNKRVHEEMQRCISDACVLSKRGVPARGPGGPAGCCQVRVKRPLSTLKEQSQVCEAGRGRLRSVFSLRDSLDPGPRPALCPGSEPGILRRRGSFSFHTGDRLSLDRRPAPVCGSWTPKSSSTTVSPNNGADTLKGGRWG